MYLWPFIFTAHAITSILDDFLLLLYVAVDDVGIRKKVFNTFLYLPCFVGEL